MVLQIGRPPSGEELQSHKPEHTQDQDGDGGQLKISLQVRSDPRSIQPDQDGQQEEPGGIGKKEDSAKEMIVKAGRPYGVSAQVMVQS